MQFQKFDVPSITPRNKRQDTFSLKVDPTPTLTPSLTEKIPDEGPVPDKTVFSFGNGPNALPRDILK